MDLDSLHAGHPRLPDGTTVEQALTRLFTTALALATDTRLPGRLRCPLPDGLTRSRTLELEQVRVLTAVWSGTALVTQDVSVGPVRLSLDQLVRSAVRVLAGEGAHIDEVAAWTRQLAEMLADHLPGDVTARLLADTPEPDVGQAALVLRVLDAVERLAT